VRNEITWQGALFLSLESMFSAVATSDFSNRFAQPMTFGFCRHLQSSFYPQGASIPLFNYRYALSLLKSSQYCNSHKALAIIHPHTQ
jgi:hypothetical protein